MTSSGSGKSRPELAQVEARSTSSPHASSSSANPVSSDTPTAEAARKVAIAVDLSDDSACIVKWAADHFLRPRDDVVLLHFDSSTTSKATELAQPLIDAKVPYKIQILKDYDMKERLCLEVERLGFTFVIMGTRGFCSTSRGSDDKLGSVSDYFVNHCVCPVVVVRHPDEKAGNGVCQAIATVIEAEEEGVAEEHHDAAHECRDKMIVDPGPRSGAVLTRQPQHRSDDVWHGADYNTLTKIAVQDRGYRTMTQHALHRLHTRGYYFKYRTQPQDPNTISNLFFAHKDGIYLLKKFPYVIVLDCTYKTNAYDIPLCELVGFTCTGKQFCIAYAFMVHEDLPTYEWVLNELKILLGPHVTEAFVTDRERVLLPALKSVFPDVQHLLCWVHITRNCEKMAFQVTGSLELAVKFKSNCWGLFCSESQEIFETRKRALYAGWHPYPTLMSYVQNTWLNDYQTSIIRCWTDRAMHFCTRTTNRVESQHKVLKEALHSSTKDFCYILDAIHRVNECQIHDLRTSLEMNRFKWPTEAYGVELFNDIKLIVSKICFDHLFVHYKKVVEGTISPECRCTWRVVYGLPCPHEVQR